MKTAIDKFRKLLPINPKKTDRLWKYYLSSFGTERKETEELIDILLLKIGRDFNRKVFLDPPAKNLCFGEYKLGKVIYPLTEYSAFGLREEDWFKHVLITGMTGTGKTNTCFVILRELNKRKKPFLIFDWKKNYKDLLFLDEFKSMKRYAAGSIKYPFYFNPLIPPKGTDATQWLLQIVDVMKHAYFVGEGVEYLLRKAIHYYYVKFNTYQGSNQFPTFFHIYDFVKKMDLKARMMLWKASTLRVLASLTFPGSMGRVIGKGNNELIEKALSSNTILELDALADSDKVFLTEAMIMYIYEKRKNETSRNEFKHALIIEEAHHILNKKKEKSSGVETIMETALRQIREFGEAVIVVDQEPSKLSDSILANTNTKICFNLGNGKDIEVISKSLMLSDEEKQYIDLLPVGTAIIKLKERFFQPVLVRFERYWAD